METRKLFGERTRQRYYRIARNKSTSKIWQAWQDDIKTWTGLLLVEAVRATKDRSQWRKIIHDAAKPHTAEED